MDLSTTTVGSPAAVAYQEAAASVVHTEVGAKRLDLSRRPTCCTTWQRPTNIRLLRKSRFGQTPDHRSMNDSSGISSMPPESDGFKRTPSGVPATLSHVSLLGLSALATPCNGELRFSKCVSSQPSIFGRSPESSDSTGTFGFQPEPSGSRAPIGSSPAAFTNKNPSGFAAQRRRSSEDFGPPPVRYNRHPSIFGRSPEFSDSTRIS